MKMSEIEALKLLAKTEMKEFDEDAWSAFAGCESERPMIGFAEEEGIAIIVDGSRLTIITPEEEHTFTLVHTSTSEREESNHEEDRREIPSKSTV